MKITAQQQGFRPITIHITCAEDFRALREMSSFAYGEADSGSDAEKFAGDFLAALDNIDQDQDITEQFVSA